MAKPVVGLALGGGGAKGWAHIGIIKALAEYGIVPDVVAGTSIGALVGGAYAAGKLGALDAWVRDLRWAQVVRLLDVRFAGGLIQGDRVFGEIGEGLEGVHIESLKHRFGAVATDLERGTEVWLREGQLMPAIRASAALPGLFSPTEVNEQWLVDGGLVNPVPVSLCRALGADFVIAVDLNAYNLSQRAPSGALLDDEFPELEAVPAVMDKPSMLQSLSEGFGVRAKFYDILEDMVDKFRMSGTGLGEAPSLMDVAVRSINIMSIRISRSRLAGDPPDILLRPHTHEIGLMEFHRGKECIELGKQELERQSMAVKALHAALEGDR
ncbi:MAG: patatin-like phospholipase family protein [bacterium]